MKKNAWILFLLWSFGAQAQIQTLTYSDTIVGPGQIIYDVNSDGTDDFQFEIITLSPGGLAQRIVPLNFSAILDNSTFGYPDALLFDDTVASYFNINPGVLGTFVSSGQFNGMGNRYLGMRINATSDAFYGWFYINCSYNRDTIIIRTAAYNSTPWEGINAGQTVITGSDEIAASGMQFSLFPNPANDQLYISSSSFAFPLAYKILDSRGSVVSSAVTNGIVQLSDLPNGIYHLQLEGKDQSAAKTFLISR
ncbi:MAG TPA: hypothetical protein DEP18_06980 [Flavobacteriales bacterium]|nr:hypothetical protein [Flavobacteriales bacterium]HCA83515.1 hypothetical protein [Flavobacteriales bacterium]HRE75814.1 T9SS type A sorting domain-containing protein [Flavobacteriales bacterium]HRE96550.1 T9SS type A sorting domain-containing protein [Flavobacteriales bacterium]HRJ34714.1 T9SS type A sorting domain-containing protein [Flavobacteriales bacterium]